MDNLMKLLVLSKNLKENRLRDNCSQLSANLKEKRFKLKIQVNSRYKRNKNLNKIRPVSNLHFISFQAFASNDTDGSDDDFKPKRKVELTDENAQQIIGKWVQENDIVLFMKGTPMSPMCGYSNYVV